MLANTFGRPLRYRITPEQASDIVSAPGLLEDQRGGAVPADKACDGNDLARPDRRHESHRCHPVQAYPQVAIPRDETIHEQRNQIERCLGRLKHLRRFAPRYDRRTVHFTGFVHLAAAMIRLRWSIPPG